MRISSHWSTLANFAYVYENYLCVEQIKLRVSVAQIRGCKAPVGLIWPKFLSLQSPNG